MGSGASNQHEDEVRITRIQKRRPVIPKELVTYEYPFENLVLAGGGGRTYSYLGALKVLEEVGVLKKIKRYAGTSGGAIMAMLLSLGCDVEEMYKIYTIDMDELAKDAQYGFWSVLPNMVWRYGWNPGNKLTSYMEGVIEEKCGSPGVTFAEIYKERGVELCVVATNVSTQMVEYFHPKTTPSMKIVTAVRMSLSVPGMFQPVCLEKDDGIQHYYVDGAVLCNYPLNVFDGWYLSMETEDAFLHKLGSDEKMFGKPTIKTLGMDTYSTGTTSPLLIQLHERYRETKLTRPDTALARARAEECDRYLRQLEYGHSKSTAAKAFLAVLQDSNSDGDDQISAEEFKLALTKVKQKHMDILFKKKLDVDEMFMELDLDGNGQVTHDELLRFMEKHHFLFRSEAENRFWMKPFNNVMEYGVAVLESIDATMNGLLRSTEDVSRTVGIHTDYIQAYDFKHEEQDREFLSERGEVAVLAFLKEFIQDQNK